MPQARHDRHVTSALTPDAWGIHGRWVDARDDVQDVAAATVAVLRDLVGRPPADLASTAPIVTRPGSPLAEAGHVTCEDGTRHHVTDRLPATFPLGYHRIAHDDGRVRDLIVSPGRCWLPDDAAAWGWAIQLYAARSRRSWGIGDLRDLRLLREWAQDLGAGFLLVNPLHAVAPTLPQEDSPYLPTTRRFRNPLYLCVEECVGADLVDLTEHARAGAALNALPLIDRDQVAVLKRRALREIHDAWNRRAETAGAADTDHAAFAAWRADQGDALADFALWMVLAAEHGPDWRTWPDALRHPDSPESRSAAAARAADLDFEAWLQWQLAEQLRAAGDGLVVIQDLPVGVDGGGADAWVWQDVLAPGVSIGAPPDLFSSAGQSWGSPPLVPWRLRAAGYRPFIESVRATMAHAGGLRIDHVMGLFRLWWVPPDSTPADGAYLRYPSDDLLDIVALESHRERAVVVGEDLGTVEPGVRETLADRAMLSYRLALFEPDPPEQWPTSAMAAISTHDLPTLAGLWTEADLDERRAHTTETPDDLRRQHDSLVTAMRAFAGSDPSDVDAFIVAAHHALGRSPSLLISATLDDAVAAPLRPNMPGAVDRPNWRIPLPVLVDDLPAHPLARQVANVLKAARNPGRHGSNG